MNSLIAIAQVVQSSRNINTLLPSRVSHNYSVRHELGWYGTSEINWEEGRDGVKKPVSSAVYFLPESKWTTRLERSAI